MGDQRLRPGVRRADRHRRPPRRPLRAQAHLHDRRRLLRRLLAGGGAHAERRAVDRVPWAHGHRWRADVAGDPRDDVRAAPRGEGGPGRRADPRRRRPRQRGRAAPGRLPHRRVELAVGVLHQPARDRLRGAGDLPRGAREHGRRHRTAHRLRRDRGAVDRDHLDPARARRRTRRRLRRSGDPRALRTRRGAARLVPRRRAPARRGRARAQRRVAQPRVHGGVRRGAADVSDLLLRAPLPAAVLREGPRLLRRWVRARACCR